MLSEATGKIRFLLAALPAVLIAALPQAQLRAQIVPPQVLEQSLPEAPRNGNDVPLEGWVILRYSVLTDGSTANITVVEKQPSLIASRRAISAVAGWKFSPATIDGAPVDWHNNEALVAYRSDAARLSPLFFRAYDSTQAYIEEGKLDWARRNNQRTLTRATRLDVVGPVLIQNVVINIQIGDLNAAYEAIRRATDPRVELLTGNELLVALKHRNLLEFQLGNIIGALDTLERRRALGDVPDDDPIAALEVAIEQGLSQGSTIGHQAKIIDETWRHTLDRQIFAIQQVDGEIETLRAECDRRIAELEYVPNSEWTLPESWGVCSVWIEGQDDTKFVLYEFDEDSEM